MKKYLSILILMLILSAATVRADFIAIETFEDDTINQNPTEFWYTYSEGIGGSVGAWDANVSNIHAFNSTKSMFNYNSRTEFLLNETNMTLITFYYFINQTPSANGGWIRIINGTNWATDPIIMYLHTDQDFYYENGTAPPTGLGMGIKANTWYKVEFLLNWTNHTCNFLVYNYSSNSYMVRGWDTMYNQTQSSYTLFHYRDTGGHKENVWLDNITFSANYNFTITTIVSTTTTIDESYFILGAAAGVLLFFIALFFFASSKRDDDQ